MSEPPLSQLFKVIGDHAFPGLAGLFSQPSALVREVYWSRFLKAAEEKQGMRPIALYPDLTGRQRTSPLCRRFGEIARSMDAGEIAERVGGL